MARSSFRIELNFSGSFAEWNEGDISRVSSATELDFELSDFNAEEDLEENLDALGLSEDDYSFSFAEHFSEPSDYNALESRKLGALFFDEGARARYVLTVASAPSDALTSAIHNAYRMASCRVEGDGINAHDDFPKVVVTQIEPGD